MLLGAVSSTNVCYWVCLEFQVWLWEIGRFRPVSLLIKATIWVREVRDLHRRLSGALDAYGWAPGVRLGDTGDIHWRLQIALEAEGEMQPSGGSISKPSSSTRARSGAARPIRIGRSIWRFCGDFATRPLGRILARSGRLSSASPDQAKRRPIGRRQPPALMREFSFRFLACILGKL